MKSSKYVYLFWLMFVIGLAACVSDGQQEDPDDDFLLGGIQINAPDHHQWMSVLKDAEMNTVSITVYARQYHWNHYLFSWDSLDVPNVIHEIEVAKANNMKVVFIPRIMLDHYYDNNRFLWHGMIMPKSESFLLRWFASYAEYIRKWAEICEEYDVDVFAIGSELRTLSQTQGIKELPDLESYYLNPSEQQEYIDDRMAFKDDIPPEKLWVRGEYSNYEKLENYLKDEVAAKVEWANEVSYQGNLEKMNRRRASLLEKWYDLIKVTRKSYSGKLTYAANFDNYQNIAFWDQLDFIGINAYFKLRKHPLPATAIEKYDEMEDSWDSVFKNILDFQTRNGLELPLLFTELGYTDKENCTLMPWEGSGFSIIESRAQKSLIVWDQQTPDIEERALAIRALRVTNSKYNHMLKGLLYWKLTAEEHHQGIEPFLMYLNKDTIDPMHLELLGFKN